MNSHIQIPKCVFKEFVNDGNFFYKFDVKTKKVSKGYPKTTYTSENYYTKSMEQKLNKYVETPLNKLLLFARQLPTRELPVVVENEIKNLALTYVQSLVARSPILFESMIENSVYLQFLPRESLHDIAVNYAMRDNNLKKFYENYQLSFMVNMTDNSFVLPTRGQYEYQINEVQCINVPLTPKCSIFFKEPGKKIHKSVQEENFILYIKEDCIDIVNKLNRFAVETQCRDSNGYIVCDEKDYLIQLFN